MSAFGKFAQAVCTRAGFALQKQETQLIDGMFAAEWPCQLAEEKWTPENHPRRAVAEVKTDGARCLYINTRIVSREAAAMNAALHCVPALRDLEISFGEPMVFDGEYQATGGFDATLSELRKEEGTGTFHLFDAVPLREWTANEFTQSWDERQAAIRAAFATVTNRKFVSFVAARPIEAHYVMPIAQSVWAAKGEGLVIKDRNALYSRGRSSAWQKVKRSQTTEGVVMDVAGTLGRVQDAVAIVRIGGRSVRIGSLPATLHALAARDLRGEEGGLTGLCVEVGFMDRTESGAYRHAKILRLRPDRLGA